MLTPSQTLSWIFENNSRWEIICGDTRGIDDAERREILLHLIDNRLYSFAFVLLTTHGYLQSVHHAIAKSIDKFTDEQCIKAFLADVAENMITKNSPHSA